MTNAQLTLPDAAANLLDQHGGDALAAIVACLREIDRLGESLDDASCESSFGYTRGRLWQPELVATAPARPQPLDL